MRYASIAMKQIIVLNGVHQAGKSTMGARLAGAFPGFSFYGELGADVRSRIGGSPTDHDEGFDREVIRVECARDRLLLGTAIVPIVETWHIGNMAYALERSPRLGSLYERLVRRKMAVFHPFVILIDITEEVFAERSASKYDQKTTMALWRFYEAIRRNLLNIYARFKIRSAVISAQDTVGATYSVLVKRLSEEGLMPSATISHLNGSL